MQEAEIRQIVQAQIIECLNRFYAIETGMWGGPLDALMVRTIITGKVQGRYYDLSSLSMTLGLPISTTHRKVRELEAAGLVESRKCGRSLRLEPTSRACVDLDMKFEEMVSTLQRLYRGPPILSGNTPAASEKGPARTVP
ncbi:MULTISPECIES: hypothetical protein [unclassified Hoeflea]|uniref:hypothetical protein n=1 Tax=unclassified Hoeflea TaxID=2614931 RepID=UPI002AFFF4A9|nr:hypothetical protein [Hoeflea sp.]